MGFTLQNYTIIVCYILKEATLNWLHAVLPFSGTFVFMIFHFKFVKGQTDDDSSINEKQNRNKTMVVCMVM